MIEEPCVGSKPQRHFNWQQQEQQLRQPSESLPSNIYNNLESLDNNTNKAASIPVFLDVPLSEEA
jgi:hypothetical protein